MSFPFRTFLTHSLSVLGLLLGILFPATTLAKSNRSLDGTVTTADQQPLEDAQVYLYEVKRGTVTDENGNFHFDDLPAGSFTLSVSYTGYKTITQIVDLRNESPQKLDISLERTTLSTEPLLVTGSSVTATSNIPLDTRVITQEQLSEQGNLTLWQSLEAEGGVNLITNGPGIERPMIHGVTTDRIQIINRGTEYHYQTWDPESGLSMDGNATQQVEILRGPATLEYGGGALGGVVSLAQDRSAPVGQTLGHYQLGLYSNTLGINNQLSLRKATKRNFFGFSAGFNSQADYRPGAEEDEVQATGEEEEKVENSRFNDLQFQLNGGLKRDWGTTELIYEFQRHKNGIVEVPMLYGPTMGNEEEEEGRSIHRPYHGLTNHALISKTDWFRGNSQIHLMLGLQRNRQQEFEEEYGTGSGEEEAAMDLTLNSLNYEAKLIQQWTSKLEMQTGFEGSVRQNISKGEETFVPNADLLEAGAFAILNWKPIDNLTLRGGLRYDLSTIQTEAPEEGNAGSRIEGVPLSIDKQYSNAGGSLGLAYHFAPGSVFKLNAGLGYRMPNIAELTADGILMEQQRYYVGDNDLSPERNWELDASLNHENRNLTVNLHGFYSNYANYITPYQRSSVFYISSPSGVISVYPIFEYRQYAAKIYGGNAGVTLHPEVLPWVSLKSDFQMTIGKNEDTGNPLYRMPAHRWSNSIRLHTDEMGSLIRPEFEVAVRKYFEQDRVAATEDPTEGYLLTDAYLRTSLPVASTQLRFTLAAHNLFNVRYVSHLSLLKEQYVANMGRNITLTARIPFHL
jgi:iron complex outermembrane receptor protein